MLYVNRPTLKHIDGLGQDCSNSIAYALGLQQTCTKPSISTCYSLVLPMYSLLGYHGTISTLRQYQTTFQAVLGNIVLTHWGREKMDIFQTTFSNALFFNETIQISIKIWLKFVRKGPINNIPALVWGNGFTPTRRQTIIWTKYYWFTDAYMCHSGLMS